MAKEAAPEALAQMARIEEAVATRMTVVERAVGAVAMARVMAEAKRAVKVVAMMWSVVQRAAEVAAK